ncbi:pimeloyl-ACP methyl ester carboxylesterase [Actinoalloteichus hoggarensis]|uniref:alpha/beta fold hydrolase n=1 Tax=Actinoalloteichus hoggarensis TaxID=1470176 RepID=UPI0018401251|nr:alpha/beta hydrolase [Actinoalloteichus hoggarensis]MBB5921936.1 pimeloyl-ACP methyl ester carboxylesterase [Actinoalloteichus hoggarensis]
MTVLPASQISPHHAEHVRLPGGSSELAALRARLAGGRNPDATVVLLPGYTGSKEDFAPILDPLAEAGFEAVAVDLPGQFESPGLPERADHRPRPLGEVVAKLVAELRTDGRPLILLGHSYGGVVAREAVVAGAPVDGLVLLCSGPGALPPGPRRQTLDLGEPVLIEHGIEGAQRLREAQDTASPASREQPAELRAFLRRRFLASAPECLLGMADGLRYEPDRVAELRAAVHAAGLPVLVSCGVSDDAWSIDSQRDMARRLDAEFVLIDSASHSPNTENPAGLVTALVPVWRRWLGSD